MHHQDTWANSNETKYMRNIELILGTKKKNKNPPRTHTLTLQVQVVDKHNLIVVLIRIYV